MNILIIGAGEIGQAIGAVVSKNGQVRFWDVDPARSREHASIAELAPGADGIILCTPTSAIRSVVVALNRSMERGTPILCFSKGIELKSHFTVDDILAASLPKGHPFALVGGPMLAEELVIDKPGIAVIASKSAVAVDFALAAFEDTVVICEPTREVHATALCSVLKNVYAVGLGIADGLGWGWNAKGWFAARAQEEMGEILKALGEKPTAAHSTAGAGDFLATAYSPYSRNQTVGRAISQGGACPRDSEGCIAMPSLVTLLGDTKHFPLFHTVRGAIGSKKAPGKLFDRLLWNR